MNPDPINLMPALTRLAWSLAADPVANARDFANLMASDLALRQRATRWFLFGDEPASGGAAPSGMQFRDPDWARSPFFGYLRDSHHERASCLARRTASTPARDIHERRKLDMLARLIAEACSPENFALTNPAVLRQTREEGGRNLARGIRNLATDLARTGWPPQPAKTDRTAFTVGVDVAATDGKVIWRNRLFELIQYQPRSRTTHATPLLIVPPWINKFYILDLGPQQSMMRWLLDNGHNVFLMSWVDPDSGLGELGFADYLREGALEAIARTREESGAGAVNVAAYCIGGTLMATALATLADSGDSSVASCTFFASQFDFTDAGDLMALTDERTVTELGQSMRESGVLPASAMAGSFDVLRAADLYWHFAIRSYLLGLDPPAFNLLYWNADSTRMPARLLEEYLRWFYRENRLARGHLALGGTPLDLGKVTVPTYHVATGEDHIAPAESVYRGVRLLGGDSRFVLADSGHIAGIINPPAAKRSGYRAGGKGESLAAWRERARYRNGSWWRDWKRWLARQAGERKEPPEPGATLGVIGDAPGDYVRGVADA